MISILNLLNSDLLNGVANLGQIYDVALNVKQVSNDAIMQKLENQDRLYLIKCINQNEKIISQNEEILEKLDILLSQARKEA